MVLKTGSTVVTNEVIYEMHQPRIKSEIKFKPTNERKDKWMFVKTNFWVSWGYFDVVSEFYVQIFVTNWVEKQCENCVHLFFGVAEVDRRCSPRHATGIDLERKL